jgi:hypothetical protein
MVHGGLTIIGLSGHRGTGKTTLATYLFRHHGFTRVGFSEKLKEIALNLFPLTVQDVTEPKKKEAKFGEYDWTPREFLVNLGEFMRYHDKDYWLKQGLALCKHSDQRYVFDDVRFKNEFKSIRDGGGYIIRLNRYPKLNVYGETLDIPSEHDLDNEKFDFTIHDCENTDLRSLYNAGAGIMKIVLGEKNGG